MLTSSAGAISKRQRGITLLEMLVVVSLIAVIAGLSYSPVSAGLETLRLRSAGDVVMSFLSASVDRAERKQAVVEVRILPAQNLLVARTSDQSFLKRVDLPQGTRIARIAPEVPGTDPLAPRRFLLYPGGTAPRIGVELVNAKGRRRLVSLDPLTGTARAQEMTP